MQKGVGNGEIKSLDEICESFDIVLLDTCALISYLDSNGNYSGLKGKIETHNTQTDSIVFFRKNLKRYRELCSTKEILNELRPGNDENSREPRGLVGRGYSNGVPEKERELYGRFLSSQKEARKLTSLLKKQKRIMGIKENEKGFHEEMYRRNLDLMSDNGLSFPDYDLLIKGGILSFFRGKTALISNDSGIINSYRRLIFREEFINSDIYASFKRKKKEFFSLI
ncbi:MAG: hypothetical protein WDZ69_02265 [Candidatus Pacearchaeota archaeon]